ncbi:S8 family serine peptidase [Streptomyces sp. 1331.2]|uniref:cyanobactin maturation protease PatG family protein n=1 Tax=Streptomyces sp. 1331.2 TaxID=1938835 RepID=UPI000BC9A097|nr:S8 family serine peptidase [Streptomyces sp. 1331.2]SOB88851.1 cyanobactin maturation protease, PatA/PatG family [Streptomyces sp. 1331.2]
MEARAVLYGSRAPEDDLLGDPAVCIAVLDGPVDLSHPCFDGADLTRLDTLVTEPAGGGRMSLHGTHVASLLFGQPGSPVTGLAPRCRGLILPVFTDAGEGRVPQLDLARAVERAVQEGAHIVNISGGEPSRDAQADAMLERALRLCDESGVLVVAAVGNDGCDCEQVPAAVPTVLAVGAAGPGGEPLESSNWGSAYATNGVLAPGQGIEGAAPGGGRTALTGSSFATPLVSGVAALLVGAQVRAGHRADPLAAGRAILQGAAGAPCAPAEAPECRRLLVGHLNAARAYELITREDLTARRSAAETTADGVRTTPSPEAGAAAIGAPSSLGTFPSDSHEGASTMDTESVPAVTAQAAPIAQSAPYEAFAPAAVPAAAAAVAPAAAPAVVPAAAAAPGTPPVSPVPVPPSAPAPAQAAVAGATASGFAPAAPVLAAPVPAAPVPTAASSPPAPAAAVPTAPATLPPDSGRLSQAPCACQGGVRPSCASTNDRPLVFAIGQVGVDFQTEARRDSFRQLMDPVQGKEAGGSVPESPANPYDAQQLHDYLTVNPWASDKVTWTLNLESTPVYAMEAELPVGMDWPNTPLDTLLRTGRTPEQLQELDDPVRYRAQAQALVADPAKLTDLLMSLDGPAPPVSMIYRSFRDAYLGQHLLATEDGYISRISVPGRLTDRTVRLFSGQVVPVIEIKSRGVYIWYEKQLVDAVVQAVKKEAEQQKVTINELYIQKTMIAFLDKVYYQFRNLGQTSADRALNAAGTNAFSVAKTISRAMLLGQDIPSTEDQDKPSLYCIDSVSVTKSPYCRMGSDCQDVRVSFFDPENERRARVNMLFTIDVSDEFPVTLAPAHQFIES